ncbi:MAG: hypothetical protein ACJ8J0_11540 [Longimicrobiaceae bacterium]
MTVDRRTFVIFSAALLAACGGKQEKAADVPPGGSDCRVAQGDSAQAVCIAVNEVERRDHFRSRMSAYQQRGDTTCVETGPADSRTLDGGGAVEVVQGRVSSVVLGDSVGCRKF